MNYIFYKHIHVRVCPIQLLCKYSTRFVVACNLDRYRLEGLQYNCSHQSLISHYGSAVGFNGIMQQVIMRTLTRAVDPVLLLCSFVNLSGEGGGGTQRDSLYEVHATNRFEFRTKEIFYIHVLYINFNTRFIGGTPFFEINIPNV